MGLVGDELAVDEEEYVLLGVEQAVLGRDPADWREVASPRQL